KDLSSSSHENSLDSDQNDIIKFSSPGIADVRIYYGLDELEESAQFIIEAQVAAEQVVKQDDIGDGRTETVGYRNVKVNKVYKGNVKVGDVIEVAEPGYFIKPDVYEAYEGYKMMESGGRYILFLRSSMDGEFSGIMLG